MTRDSLLVFYL